MAYGIRPGDRALLIGASGCGKSTVGTDLVKRFLIEYPNAIAGIIDSKPRYRASHHVNGTPLRYREWAKGDTITDSVAVYSDQDFRSAYQFSRCAILQSLHPNRNEVDDFEEQAARFSRWLFRRSSSARPAMLYIDEYYDILGGALAAIADRRVLRVTRAGREFDMASLFGAQRPKSIPLPSLTEATKYWIFNLEYEEDVKYFRKHGPRLHLNPHGYSFVYYERLIGGGRVEKMMRLRLNSPKELAHAG